MDQPHLHHDRHHDAEPDQVEARGLQRRQEDRRRHQDDRHRRQEEAEDHDHHEDRREQDPLRQVHRDDCLGRALRDVQRAHHVGIQQRHADDEHQHRRLADRRREDRPQLTRAPDEVHDRDQHQREHAAEARGLRRRCEAAVERDHHADQQHDERQDTRQHLDALGHRVMVRVEQRRRRHRGADAAAAFVGAPRDVILLPVAIHRVAGEQRDQQDPRADAGEEQPAERLLGGDRVQDHRDRRRQQDAERPARGDDAGREAGRVAALPHLRDAGAADRRARRRARSRHGREQRAREHVRDAEAAGNLPHPRVHRRIEVLAGRRLADRRALEDEERDRQQRDARHLLVDVLRDGVERRRRHEEVHEGDRDRAERERDRHAGEHHDERRDAVRDPDREFAHVSTSPAPLCLTSRPMLAAGSGARPRLGSASRLVSSIKSCSASSVMPSDINE